ncbi:MAG: hypothetical protein ACI9ON_002033 [Limisphaerales bacterium]|jgi:hypothetical protein
MQMRMIIAIITTWITSTAFAGEAPLGAQVYLDADAYVTQTFSGSVPTVKTVWPTGELRSELQGILGHRPALRFKYWGANGKTVWVLDEVGKDRPITAAVVINQGKIEDVQVLVFRESRGWEVKYNFFTRQFADLWLRSSNDLSGHIDNITGATLSVKAMTRMAKAALKLHEHSNQSIQSLAHAR